MSINLLELVQQNLGYPPLLKMDANTEEVVVDVSIPHEDRFSQAAIPAVLIAFYQFSCDDASAEMLLQDKVRGDWITLIYDGKAGEVVQVVAAYSKQSPEDTLEKMKAIADEAVRLIILETGTAGTAQDVKTLLAGQRNDILPYLPAGMQLGALLNDPTLDDRTNKMQGPVSGLMHFIGNQLSGSGIKKETPTW